MKPFYITLIFLALYGKMQAQIINVEDKRVRLNDSIALKGYADLAVSAVKNDKNLVTVSANSQLEYVKFKHLFLLIGGYNLVKAGSNNFLNDGYSHFRYNYDVSKNVTWEAFTQAQYNERTRSRFRALVGTGARFKFQLSEKQRFYLGTAFMFEHNQFSDATARQYDVRLSNYLSFTVAVSDKIKLNNTTYFQPILTDLGNFRVSSQGNALFQITKKLVFKVSGNLILDRDGRLPPSVPDLIYAWTNGLRWEFGNN
jgi:Protein of unknown function, DUF481